MTKFEKLKSFCSKQSCPFRRTSIHKNGVQFLIINAVNGVQDEDLID